MATHRFWRLSGLLVLLLHGASATPVGSGQKVLQQAQQPLHEQSSGRKLQGKFLHITGTSAPCQR
jgi:hypothetical protein